ncbi:Uncharacterized protein Fot_04255 [Forsythia ovata]|uniref:Uncharacterized protein n=1 Tax=Forsythia ovata TaxID=205694 RepID=A0ABD1XC09_9LAMI
MSIGSWDGQAPIEHRIWEKKTSNEITASIGGDKYQNDIKDALVKKVSPMSVLGQILKPPSNLLQAACQNPKSKDVDNNYLFQKVVLRVKKQTVLASKATKANNIYRNRQKGS